MLNQHHWHISCIAKTTQDQSFSFHYVPAPSERLAGSVCALVKSVLLGGFKMCLMLDLLWLRILSAGGGLAVLWGSWSKSWRKLKIFQREKKIASTHRTRTMVWLSWCMCLKNSHFLLRGQKSSLKNMGFASLERLDIHQPVQTWPWTQTQSFWAMGAMPVSLAWGKYEAVWLRLLLFWSLLYDTCHPVQNPRKTLSNSWPLSLLHFCA